MLTFVRANTKNIRVIPVCGSPPQALAWPTQNHHCGIADVWRLQPGRQTPLTLNYSKYFHSSVDTKPLPDAPAGDLSGRAACEMNTREREIKQNLLNFVHIFQAVAGGRERENLPPNLTEQWLHVCAHIHVDRCYTSLIISLNSI